MSLTERKVAKAVTSQLGKRDGSDMRLPSGTPALPVPERQRKAAEVARPLSRSHGVVTGVRLVLWLGSHARPCDVNRVARGLKLDVKHVRESLTLLAELGLIQSHEELRAGVRSVRVFSLLGGYDVVPVPVHDDEPGSTGGGDR